MNQKRVNSIKVNSLPLAPLKKLRGAHISVQNQNPWRSTIIPATCFKPLNPFTSHLGRANPPASIKCCNYDDRGTFTSHLGRANPPAVLVTLLRRYRCPLRAPRFANANTNAVAPLFKGDFKRFLPPLKRGVGGIKSLWSNFKRLVCTP
jgi:hypothetical protein